MSNKNCVVIVAINRSEDLKMCKELAIKYCNKYNLDFIVISESKYNISVENDNSYIYTIFEKNQIYDLFGEYKRVLRLDVDTLISPLCTNVFDIVPYDCIGGVYEDVGSRRVNRLQQIASMKLVLGDISTWYSGYLNSGVVVASDVHKDIFKMDESTSEAIVSKNLGFCKEQNLFNWRVRYNNVPVYQLEYKFNHMSMFSEPWKGADYRDSYIIHYAGSVNKTNMFKGYYYFSNMWKRYEENINNSFS